MAGCVIPSASRRATTRRPGGRAARRRPAVASRAAPGPSRGRVAPGRRDDAPAPAWGRSKPGVNSLGAPVTSRDAIVRTPSSAARDGTGRQRPSLLRPRSHRSARVAESVSCEVKARSARRPGDTSLTAPLTAGAPGRAGRRLLQKVVGTCIYGVRTRRAVAVEDTLTDRNSEAPDRRTFTQMADDPFVSDEVREERLIDEILSLIGCHPHSTRFS